MGQAKLFKVALILGVLLSVPGIRGQASPVQQGCPSAKGEYRIGFVNLGLGSPYTSIVSQGIEQAARQTGKIELVTMAEPDAAAALARAKQLTAQPLDGLIVYSLDGRLDKDISEHLRATKLPVVSVDAAWPAATFVGADIRRAALRAGAALAQWIKQNWDGEPDAIVFLEPSEHTAIPSAQLREMFIGLRNNLTNQVPDERIIHLYTESLPSAAHTAMIGAYQKLGSLSRIAILAMDDFRAAGAVSAAQALHRTKPALLIAQHATVVDLSQMAGTGSSYLGATDYFPEKYGEKVIQTMLDMLACKTVPASVYTDYAFISDPSLCEDPSAGAACAEPRSGGSAEPSDKTTLPTGFIEQPSYSGDCRLRPRGTVCVRYGDGYIWLISSSVYGMRQIQEGDDTIQIAVGDEALYYHVLKTNKVKLVIVAPRLP